MPNNDPIQYTFVNVDAFTPATGYWTPVGNIASHTRNGNVFTLNLAAQGPQMATALQISFLSATCFRVRFNPQPNFNYAIESSFAVVNRNLGPVNLNIVRDDGHVLEIDTGAIQVVIQLQPFQLQVYRQGQLIHSDLDQFNTQQFGNKPGYNIVYIPGQQVVANMKFYPAGAHYCGLGEKAGTSFLKEGFTYTQFNYDNFKYVTGILPAGNSNDAGNPSQPLYCSIPLLLEVNPSPASEPGVAVTPYAYGLFFDNPAQSYFNIGVNDYAPYQMYGKYYFGALFGDLDYYFMAGDGAGDVLAQYTNLTGRAPMPPKYVFGYHQGAYGYYNRDTLESVARQYRAAAIPIDGLHIDVDFQNNYRTFTHSEIKFPDAKVMFDGLHTNGFKCSTNITPLLANNVDYNGDVNESRIDEFGKPSPYAQRDAIQKIGGLLSDTHNGGGVSPNLFSGKVNYGQNYGKNPIMPPFTWPQGSPPFIGLGAHGSYPDFGRPDVRKVWGENYQHLIQDLGMDMIWQDMTCPALDNSGFTSPKTFPLDLMTNNTVTSVRNAEMHNLYVLLLLDATWKGIEALRPDRRNFIIARGGYAGMQRYAGLWTGDSASTWQFLQVTLPETLNLGLSGVPIAGADVGGFANGPGSRDTPLMNPPQTPGQPFTLNAQVVGDVADFELFTRWMHLGSFLPWYRNHYNGYTKQFQEPWAYGDPVPANCRIYVELRYRMLQIYYDLMYETTQTGMPIVRPLFLSDSTDPNVYSHLDDQFFVGHDFLVAPILTPGDPNNFQRPCTRNVYLPATSSWYAFKDNTAPLDAPVPGGSSFGWTATLSQVPIYIRAGAILPFRELEQWVGQLPQNPLTFNIYPGPDSSYQLYQDDGITTENASRQAYRLTTVSHRQVPGGQSVRVQRITDNYTPPEEFYFIAILGATRNPSSVSIGAANVPDVGGPSRLSSSPVDAFYWNSSIQIAFVKVYDVAADVTVTITF
jgi:alpha-glucosidase